MQEQVNRWIDELKKLREISEEMELVPEDFDELLTEMGELLNQLSVA